MTNETYTVTNEEEFVIGSVLNAIFDSLTGEQSVELRDILVSNNMQDNAPTHIFDRVIEASCIAEGRRATDTAYGTPTYEN